MAEQELSPEQTEFYQWLEELDQDRPLSALVEDPASLEVPQFPSEELDRLEELGRDYAQELFDRDAIPDLPPMDIDERLLEPEVSQELDQDLDRDR
jgi:hypothetical protein